MVPRATVALLCFACVLVAPARSSGQSTGGSFGSSSGSWGGSSGGGYGGGGYGGGGYGGGGSSSSTSNSEPSGRSSSGGWESSSSSSRDSEPSVDEEARRSMIRRWRSARQNHGQPPILPREHAVMRRHAPAPFWVFYLGVVAVVFVGLVTHSVVHRARGAWARRRARLLRLSIGFDWTVRAALQRELARLASSLSLDGSYDRAVAASRVASLLRGRLKGACYAHAVGRRVPLASAPDELALAATDLRARFRHETRGRVNADAPALRARPEEGAGLLVVTLLIGAAEGAPPIRGARDRRALERILRAIEKMARLDGFEVIWSPAEEDDRMSSYELERCYPELVRFDDAVGVGTVRCGHCDAPRPRELSECPSCGSIQVD